MTLVEALIALAFATFTIAGAIEAAHIAAQRSAVAALDIDATRIAANLLATADVRPGHFEGRDSENNYTWQLDVTTEPEFGPFAVDLSATVHMTGGGLSTEKTIATLKLR